VPTTCYFGITATFQHDFESAAHKLESALAHNARVGNLDHFATLFDVIAGLAAERRSHREVLTLLGAANAVLDALSMRRVPPIRQARRERWSPTAYAAIGHTAAEAARTGSGSISIRRYSSRTLPSAASKRAPGRPESGRPGAPGTRCERWWSKPLRWHAHTGSPAPTSAGAQRASRRMRSP
jgi:hypothetical protein